MGSSGLEGDDDDVFVAAASASKEHERQIISLFSFSRIFDLWAAAECFWGRVRGSQSNESIIFQSQKGLPPSLACSRHANIRMQLTRLLPPPWHFQALPTHSFPRKFPALPREKRGKILVACFFFLLLPCEPLLLHFPFLHFLIQ